MQNSSIACMKMLGTVGVVTTVVKLPSLILTLIPYITSNIRKFLMMLFYLSTHSSTALQVLVEPYRDL